MNRALASALVVVMAADCGGAGNHRGSVAVSPEAGASASTNSQPWVFVPPLTQADALAAIAIAPDETTVAVGTTDGIVGIWAIPSGEIRAWMRVDGPVHRLEWRADGHELFALTERAWRWDTATGRLLETRAPTTAERAFAAPRVEADRVPRGCDPWDVHLSPGGRFADCGITENNGYRHVVRSLSSGRDLFRLPELGPLQWSPSGSWLAYGSIHLLGWREDNDAFFSIAVQRGERDPYEAAVLLLPELQQIVSFHRGGIYDLAHWRVAGTYEARSTDVRPWAVLTPRWLPAPHVVASPIRRGFPSQWGLVAMPAGAWIGAVNSRDHHTHSWTADDEFLPSPSGESFALLGDEAISVVASPTATERMNLATGMLHAARWSADERSLIVLEDAPTQGVRLVRRTVAASSRSEVLHTYPDVAIGNLQTAQLSPDAHWFAVLGDAFEVRDAEHGETVWRVPRPVVPGASWDDHDTVVATSRRLPSREGALLWYELATGREHSAALDPEPIAFSVSPDGRHVAAATNAAVIVFDTASAARIAEIRPSSAHIRWLRPSGVLCLEDSAVRLWRPSDGQVLTVDVALGGDGLASDRLFAWTTAGDYAGDPSLTREVRFRRGGLLGRATMATPAALQRQPSDGLFERFLEGR